LVIKRYELARNIILTPYVSRVHVKFERHRRKYV